MVKRIKKKKGFTLIEVIVSVTIVAFVAPSLAVLFSTTLLNNTKALKYEDSYVRNNDVTAIINSDFQNNGLTIMNVTSNSIKLAYSDKIIEYKFSSNILYRKENGGEFIEVCNEYKDIQFSLIDPDKLILKITFIPLDSKIQAFDYTIKNKYKEYLYREN